ncbi:MAG: hypothetical protein WCY78_06610 [Sphaerochaetaceae bacterium]
MATSRVKVVTALVIALIGAISLLLVLSFCRTPVAEEQPIETVDPPPVVTAVEEPLIERVEPPLEVTPVEEIAEPLPVVEEPPIEKVEPLPEVVTAEEEPVVTEEEPSFEEFDDDWDEWADFFVAGDEDYSLLYDGTYYVPLLVNEEYSGDISITFEEEDIYVNTSELKKIILPLLVEEYREEFFAGVGEAIPIEEINAKGVQAWFDDWEFELHLTFTTEMMPIRNLSLNPGRLLRYGSYSMSGSQFLKPAKFSWYGNFSLYSLLSLSEYNGWKISPTSLFSLQSHNSISLFNLAFDFSYSFHPTLAYREYLPEKWSTDFNDYFTFYGIQGFYDFKSKSLRLTFGNVNDYLGFSSDTIGIALEKRFSYGDVKAKEHQLQYMVELEEPSLVEVFINDKNVYRRQLQAGLYNLKDFTFTQGANAVRIEMTPLSDENLKKVYEFSLGYDSRLLGKGDTLYTLSLSMPKLDYTKTTFRAEQHYGLTDSISGSYNFRASPSALSLGLNMIFATTFGSFDLLGGLSYSEYYGFGYFGQLGYRITGEEDSPFSSFDFTLAYRNTAYNERVDIVSAGTVGTLSTDNLDFSLSYAGRITKYLRYALSGALQWKVGESAIGWRTSVNLGLPIIPKLPISGSITISQSVGESKPTVKGQIGASYSFSPALNVSASSDFESWPQANLSWRILSSPKNNLNFSLGSFKFDNPLDHQASLSYNHSASAYGLTIRQQYADSFRRFNTSLSFNTSFAFAGGLFGMSRSIGENFLLVKPEGALKGSDIAVTKTMSTAPEPLPKLFGTGLFSGINSNVENNVVIYGIGESIMSSGASFIYDFLPRPRQGYAIRISSEMTHSIVGTLLRTADGAYSRYATDIYKVEYDEEGVETLVPDESLYIFTDESGFFFVDGITKGEYQFSLYLPKSSEEDPPVDIRFTVDPEVETHPLVFVLETFVAQDFAQQLEFENFDRMMGNVIENPLLDAEGHYNISIVDEMDEETFWNEYYPSRGIVASYHGDLEATKDSIIEKFTTDRFESSALKRLSQEDQPRYVNLSRLNSILRPYIDAILPQRGSQEEIVAP